MHFESTYAIRGGLGALRNLDPAIVLRFSMSISSLQRSVMSTRNAKRSRGSPVGLP
jgi:hypothetical protein